MNERRGFDDNDAFHHGTFDAAGGDFTVASG